MNNLNNNNKTQAFGQKKTPKLASLACSIYWNSRNYWNSKMATVYNSSNLLKLQKDSKIISIFSYVNFWAPKIKIRELGKIFWVAKTELVTPSNPYMEYQQKSVL